MTRLTAVRGMLGAICVLGLLALPAAAGAHSTIDGTNGEIRYITEDTDSANCLTITDSGSDVRFQDRCVSYGMSATGSCRPGSDVDAQTGYYYDVFCPRNGVKLLRVDVGAREDKITSTTSLPMQVLLGDGADTLTINSPAADVILGGTGNDTIVAGAGDDLVKDEDGDDTVDLGTGNDTVQGGAGLDNYAGGAGDDEIRVRDGSKDAVDCGDGTDKAISDQFDDPKNCEAIDKANVAASNSTSVADDHTAPKVAAVGLTVQHVRRSKKVRVAITCSEKGTVDMAGRIEVNGINVPLRGKPRPINVAGGGIELALVLNKSTMTQLKRAWKRGRKAYVKLVAVGTDRAGNSRTVKVPRIRLKP